MFSVFVIGLVAARAGVKNPVGIDTDENTSGKGPAVLDATGAKVDFNPDVTAKDVVKKLDKAFPNGNVQWFKWYERVCNLEYWPADFTQECGAWYWGKKYNTWTPWYYRACLTGDSKKWLAADTKYCEQFYKYVVPELGNKFDECKEEEEELAPALVQKVEKADWRPKRQSLEERRFGKVAPGRLNHEAAVSLVQEESAGEDDSAEVVEVKPVEWSYKVYYAYHAGNYLFEDDWSIATETGTSAASLVESVGSLVEVEAPQQVVSLDKTVQKKA